MPGPSQRDTLLEPMPNLDMKQFTSGVSLRDMARQSGFTGNQCSNCSGIHMKISGHCEVCTDCGTTTGCS